LLCTILPFYDALNSTIVGGGDIILGVALTTALLHLGIGPVAVAVVVVAEEKVSGTNGTVVI